MNTLIEAKFTDRTIIKVGDSYAITLPEKEVKKQGLGLGAIVDVNLKLEYEDMQNNYDEAEDKEALLRTYIDIIEKTKDVNITSKLAMSEGYVGIGFKELGNKEKEEQYIKDILKEFEQEIVNQEKIMDENNLDNFDLPSDEDFDADENPELLTE